MGLKAVIIFALVLVGLVGVVQWRALSREARAQAQFPPEGQLIDVDGTLVHAVVRGSGPDLVLIHGASGSTRDYTFAFADQLTGSYRVIIFDRPGLGWTDRPGDTYSGAWNSRAEPPMVQAQLLQKAAQKIGVHTPLVMGHSFGGAVALAWGLSQPEETAGLVLVASVSNPWPGSLGALYRINATAPGSALVVPLITAFTPEKMVRDTVASIFEPQSAPDGYLDYIGSDMTLRRKAFRANAQQVNSLRPHIVEMSQRYHELQMPVEIVHGTADTIVPLHIHSDPLSRQIPGAVLTRLDGIGHMPHHVAPLDVLAAIDRAATRAGLR
ncbi:MAG: alpha/beta hydrolase [Sulfitobacter sp.]